MSKLTIGDKCLQSYPDRIPIILNYKNFHQDTVRKLLVPDQTTIESVLVTVRRNIKLLHNEMLAVSIDGKTMSGSEIMTNLYHKHRDKYDGCLHLTIYKENTDII